MIHLHTLGEAVITVGDREVRPTSPMVFAALLYLGVERGQRVPRAALQGLLFPEADERSGSHSLRQLLYKLRQLGAPIHAEGDVVWVNPGDVQDDAAANGAPAANGNGRESSQFLMGYAPRLSSMFDEWLEQQRSSVGNTVRRRLIARMAARRSAADWPAVEEVAQEILKVDAFNEEATLALAEATALSGSKAEALRILERYESEVGHSDLKLPASVLRKRISERLPDQHRRALDTPFVGREAEAEAMRQAIGQLRRGVAGTVVIVGEPGIGKTRLLDEMTALATLEGVNVQVVRCQPHYAARPMGVFIELVPALLQCRGALGVSPEMLEHLTLLTSHRDDRANRPADARDDSTRSGILLAAVRDLVDAVSAEAPLFVVVEDAHWADSTSLIELSALVQGAKGRSVLLVYTCRVLDSLKQAGAISDATPLLRLKPLVDESMATLAAHLLPGVSPAQGEADVRTWCVNTAAGNPLYLQVLCTHYEETNEPFRVPPSMRAGTIRRIEQLPADCRRFLDFSALLGKHASLEALRSLLELSPLAFLKAVQRLESEGFVRTRDGAARLTHDLLADCALELVPPLSRQALHSCVAGNLESRYEASHDASMLWDCASHWAASGDSGKALDFVVRCARHTVEIGRATNAVSLLKSASHFALSAADEARVLNELSVAAMAADEWPTALDAINQLTSMPGVSLPTAHSDRELALIEISWCANRDSRNAASKLHVCACADGAEAAHRTKAALLLLRIAHEHGDPALAKSAYRSVESLLVPNSLEYTNRLVPLVFHTSFGSLESAITEARQLRRDLGQLAPAYELRAARNLSTAFYYLGEAQEGWQISLQYYERAQAGGLQAWSYTFAASCCLMLIELDRFEEAESWYSLAEQLRNARKGSSDVSHFGAGIELALRRRDEAAARERMAALREVAMGEMFRGHAMAQSLEVRIRQLDEAYLCEPDLLAEMTQQLRRTMRLLGMDGVAIAVCEAHTRLGSLAERDNLLREYLSARRELARIHPGLLKFVQGG